MVSSGPVPVALSCTAQVDRHARTRDSIITAAIATATQGYDTCRMRTVAQTADVVISTVYRYFPSKDDLLITCFHRWLSDFDTARLSGVPHSDPYCRLLAVAGALTDQFSSTPLLADALIRPYLGASGADMRQVDLVRERIIEIFADSVDPRRPLAEHRAIADLFADIWLTNISAVVQKRMTRHALAERFARTVDALRRQDFLR